MTENKNEANSVKFRLFSGGTITIDKNDIAEIAKGVPGHDAKTFLRCSGCGPFWVNEPFEVVISKLALAGAPTPCIDIAAGWHVSSEVLAQVKTGSHQKRYSQNAHQAGYTLYHKNLFVYSPGNKTKVQGEIEVLPFSENNANAGKFIYRGPIMLNTESLIFLKLNDGYSLFFQLKDLSHICRTSEYVGHGYVNLIFLSEARRTFKADIDAVVNAFTNIVIQQRENLSACYLFKIDFSDCPGGVITKTKIG